MRKKAKRNEKIPFANKKKKHFLSVSIVNINMKSIVSFGKIDSSSGRNRKIRRVLDQLSITLGKQTLFYFLITISFFTTVRSNSCPLLKNFENSTGILFVEKNLLTSNDSVFLCQWSISGSSDQVEIWWANRFSIVCFVFVLSENISRIRFCFHSDSTWRIFERWLSTWRRQILDAGSWRGKNISLWRSKKSSN